MISRDPWVRLTMLWMGSAALFAALLFGAGATWLLPETDPKTMTARIMLAFFGGALIGTITIWSYQSLERKRRRRLRREKRLRTQMWLNAATTPDEFEAWLHTIEQMKEKDNEQG